MLYENYVACVFTMNVRYYTQLELAICIDMHDDMTGECVVVSMVQIGSRCMD